jgi:glycosyltransferase involved in cell wall biosynthesis
MKLMKIGLDLSPLRKGHKVRGVGSYTRNLFANINSLPLPNGLKIIELQPNQSYDLIHYPYFDLFFVSLPWAIPSKFIVTIHDVIPLLYPKNYPPGIKGQIKFHIQKFLLKRAKAVITDSQTSKNDIVKFLEYPDKKIFPIKLGIEKQFQVIDNPQLFKRVKNIYHLPDKFVLYVGDVNFNKNIPNLVRACEIAQQPLVIVGKQAAENNFDHQHQENQDLVWLQNFHPLPSSNFQLLTIGFVPQEDLPVIYNLASVYSQISLAEGFGLPVLEAQACGCPVIISDAPALKEIGQDSTLITDPNNPQDIAKKINQILKQKELREKLINAGLENILKYSWEKCAKETLEIYQQVLNE